MIVGLILDVVEMDHLVHMCSCRPTLIQHYQIPAQHTVLEDIEVVYCAGGIILRKAIHYSSITKNEMDLYFILLTL